MSAFVPRGKKGQRIRVTDLDGRTKVLLCGTPDRETAEDMEAMVRRFRARRGAMNRYLLAALIDHRVKLTEVYDADCLGTLEDLVTKLKADADSAADIDISPLVDEWNGRGRKATSPKYVKQVRRFIPVGERFPLSRFRRREISKFLEELPVNDPTRNRYKAAISQFGNWLVRRELIESNPVRDAGVFSENPPKMTWLKPKDAKALVLSLSGEARFVAALMAVTCSEWQGVELGRRRDIDLDTRSFHIHGKKTRRHGAWRDRIVEATDAPEWAWAWPIVEAHARTLSPNAPLVTISEFTILRRQLAACKLLGLPHHTLHDWRHTYAVNAILRGDDHQEIKRALGHAPNSMQLHTRYGVYIAEYRRLHAKADSSTPVATPARKRAK